MSNNTEANWFKRALREIMAALDYIVYSLISFMYQLFFQVATSTILSGKTILTFYNRIQLIFGIFIMFKLAVSIINGIINPDAFTDQKQGFSQLVRRVIIALVMLTLIVPTNINIDEGSTHYQKNISTHGILFGTLNELQYYVLEENVVGKLIMGRENGYVGDSEASLKEKSNVIANSLYKSFITINLKEDNLEEADPENWMCAPANTDGVWQNGGQNPIYDKELEIYSNLTASPGDMVTLPIGYCDTEKDANGIGGIRFHFAMINVVPTICGIIFLITIIGFTIDIAIRAIKLAILRLVAPIPIISYIDPNQQKDGAFGAWVKAVIATYLDLFFRLLAIYLVLFLITEIATNGIQVEASSSYMVNALTRVLIYLGLVLFAKQAPKFLKDALGIKFDFSNIGLSGVLGGTAMALGGGGIAGFGLGMAQGLDAASDAARQGKGFSVMDSWAQNRDQMAKIRTGNKEAQGGIMGSIKDRLNWQTRENQAKRYGIGKRDIADHDALTKKAKNEMLAAQTEKEFADKQLQGAAHLNHGVDLSKYINENGSWKNPNIAYEIGQKYASDGATREEIGAIGQRIINEQQTYDRALNNSRAKDAQLASKSKDYDDLKKRGDAMRERAEQLGTAPNIRSMERTPGPVGQAVNESAVGQAFRNKFGHDIAQGGDYRSDLKGGSAYQRDVNGNVEEVPVPGTYQRDIDSSEGQADSANIRSLGTGSTGGADGRH